VTKVEGKLAEVTRSHLYQRLAEVTDPKEITAGCSVRIQKQSLTAKTEENTTAPEQSVYSWFNRVEERGFEVAL